MTKSQLIKKIIRLNKEGEKNKQKYYEVIELLNDDILKKQNSDVLYAEKSQALFRLNKYDESYIEAKAALIINPDNAKAYQSLGNFYSNENNNIKAIEYYEKAIEKDPKYAAPYHGLGNVYRDLKNYHKAKEFYQKAIEKDSNDSNHYSALGILYYLQNNFKKAEEYYCEATKIDSESSFPYYNLGILYYFGFGIMYYNKAINNFQKYIELKKSNPDEFTERAKNFIQEINDILNSDDLSKIVISKEKIKNILHYINGAISHFTSLTAVRSLVVDKSDFRLSEATFLNDSSEGKTLFDFLEYKQDSFVHKNHEYSFTQKPFIGSFVHADKHNDLALWRLYGKENGEEGKGCSITLDSSSFLQSIRDRATEATKQNFDREFQLFKVAYWGDGDIFLVDNKENEELKNEMLLLKELVNTYKEKVPKNNEETINILEELNEIAYLFKNKEYQYENEIRLVVKDPFGYHKKLEFDQVKMTTKVYIELCTIDQCISCVSIGPKTPNKEDWAAYFHYHFAQIPDNKKMKDLKIHISTLPYK